MDESDEASDAPVGWRQCMETVTRLSVTAGPWTEHRTRRCVLCGGPAFIHPLVGRIWGCKICGYTTDQLDHCFRDAEANGRSVRVPPDGAFRVHVRAPRKRIRHRRQEA